MIYKVIKTKKGYSIERPNKTLVNEWIWPTELEAEKYLNRLALLGYCK